MSARFLKPGLVLLASGLLLGGLANGANAGSGKASKTEPQKVSNAQLREALHVLQATKKMLQGADHDYGGHRVAAIKAIDAAEHQLRLALGTRGQPKKAGGGGGKGVRPGQKGGKEPEPQAISNLQLADAIVVLQKTATFLEKANHDYGGHRAAAVRDLGAAVRQLKLALKYEKKS